MQVLAARLTDFRKAQILLKNETRVTGKKLSGTIRVTGKIQVAQFSI